MFAFTQLTGKNLASRRRRRRASRPALDRLENRVLLSVVSWNVDADGSWDVAANWRDDLGVGRVPGPNDDVIIDRPAGEFAVTYRDLVGSVRSIGRAVIEAARMFRVSVEVRLVWDRNRMLEK